MAKEKSPFEKTAAALKIMEYWYAESEHYILKFPNGTYGFVMARSPREAYDNFLKENSKEIK